MVKEEGGNELLVVDGVKEELRLGVVESCEDEVGKADTMWTE
ncbi:hypothetical protein OROMI_024988 [Orobanche minor]